MEPLRIRSQLNVKHCSVCPENTEYYCHSCQVDLCLQCKETHFVDLDIRHHIVTLYRNKYKRLLKNESYTQHKDKNYDRYCETPVFFHFRKHRNNLFTVFKEVFESNSKRHQQVVMDIRSDILYNRQVLRTMLNANVDTDFKNIQNEMSNLQSALVTKSCEIKHLLEIVPIYLKLKCIRLVTKRLEDRFRALSVKKKYEYNHEHLARKPVQFLLFIKQTRLPQISDTSNQLQQLLFSLSPEIKYKDIIGLLGEIQITGRRKRSVEIHSLLKMMTSPVLQKSLKVTDIDVCFHISCVTPDRVWVSDDHGFALVDISTGQTLHFFLNCVFTPVTAGNHTVNCEGELIYIKTMEIIKCSNDMKTESTFKTFAGTRWTPYSLHCSSCTHDVLVGISKQVDTKTHEGKVVRYNTTGHSIQTIENDESGRTMYCRPFYITENTNGDIVVSDSLLMAVVVAERGGRHRFSYKGPSGSGLIPRGVCTDALSHILVCDEGSDRVHMLDKNGRFLSYLLTNQIPGIIEPRSLCYDFKEHRLMVGSGRLFDCGLSVYRYINRNLSLMVIMIYTLLFIANYSNKKITL